MIRSILKVFCRAWPGLAGMLCLVLWGTPGAAQAPGAEEAPAGAAGQAHAKPDEAVTRLEQLLQQTLSFSADVDQLLVDQDGRELQETRARLVMARPASFYWEVTAPYPELVVADGERIWRYEPDLDQVIIQAFEAELDRTPVMLLNGDVGSIAATFEVSSIQSAGNDGGMATSRFVLYPREPDSLFERLALRFEGAALVEMQFEDSVGQQTSLSFSNIERNQPVPAERFDFTPPDGVEVIDTTLE